MKALLKAVVVISMLAGPLVVMPLHAGEVRSEEGQHPHIALAIHALEQAIDDLESAPHDFGGNKARAIADSRAALASLRKALAYRAKQDNKK